MPGDLPAGYSEVLLQRLYRRFFFFFLRTLDTAQNCLNFFEK